MLRLAFFLLILIHGLIHLLGFIKAFDLASIEQLTQPISKARGLFWLTATLLMISAGILYYFKNEPWWIFALLAVLISQTLIILHWQDAKAGSFPNAALLIMCFLAFGSYRFNNMVSTEVNQFLPQAQASSSIIDENTIAHLPSPVKKWLTQSGVLGKNHIRSVHLWQSGQMRLDADKSWIPFQSEQWFTIDPPGFIWQAKVGQGSLMAFDGKDKYESGKGHMLIKLHSWIAIADANGPFIDQGAAIRYLAETLWFPSAALSPFITWKEISPYQAQATLVDSQTSVTGIFSFDENGRPVRFEADRYYDQTQKLEPWLIEVDINNYKTLNGIEVPTKANVIWKLESGEFKWLNIEVERIVYSF